MNIIKVLNHPQMAEAKVVVALILLAGVAARLSLLYFAPVEPDEEIYSYTSWEVMEGKGVFSSRVPRAPVYFYTVALIYRVGGVSLELSRLLSVAASTLTILAVYLIAKKISSEKAALLSAALFALSPFTLRYSYVALTEPYQWLFLSFSLYFFIRAVEDEGVRYLLLSGLLIAAAAGVRRSSLAVPIGLFFCLIYLRWGMGAKRIIRDLAVFTSSVVLPFGLPLYIAFRYMGGEGLRRFITFKGAEVGLYQDPWWIGIQLTWYAPVLLASLAVSVLYIVWRLAPGGRKEDILGIGALASLFLLKVSTSWEWGAESAFIMMPYALIILLVLREQLPPWLPPFMLSLAAVLSIEVFMGSFFKLVIYITGFTVGAYLLLSVSSNRYAPYITPVLTSALIFLYLQKREPHLLEILQALSLALIVSSALLYPLLKRYIWPAISASAVALALLHLSGLLPSPLPLIPPLISSVAFPLIARAPGERFKALQLPFALLPLLSLALLAPERTVILLALVISASFLILRHPAAEKRRGASLASLLLLPPLLLLFHQDLKALSSILFLYILLFTVVAAPRGLNLRRSTPLLLSSVATLGFYMRYAIMTVYTYEFTPSSAAFTGTVLGRGGERGIIRRVAIPLVVLSALLSATIYSTSPYFVRNEPDQHPYMETVRDVARIIDERTEEGEYILAWHTFAVESQRKTIIEVSNARYYPPGEVIDEMERRGVRLYVNDFFLQKLLFSKEVFREYILGNFTLVEEVEGIEIYERNLSQ